MTHSECVQKLLEIGRHFDFHASGKSLDKRYHMGNPDCVWYYKGPGEKELKKIARGDKYDYLPFIAFEVCYSEKQKALRGSLMTLQLTSASAGIFVLLGKSVEHMQYLKKLIERYSHTRLRIWTAKDVNELYDRVTQKKK